ncbi:hypothetical protein BC829DRAFT_45929 [Chytridium lagenaria]|nr:hypothetical protein BC829DRAFT_45929 [Chytridium lagenaria]
MAALTAGLAGMDADQVGASTWSQAAFQGTSVSESVGDDEEIPQENGGDEDGDQELLRRLESLGLSLPVIPTSPLKNLDDETDDTDEGGDGGVLQPINSGDHQGDAPAVTAPVVDVKDVEEEGSDIKGLPVFPGFTRRSSATSTNAVAGTDAGTDDGEFLTPVELTADDDLTASTHSDASIHQRNLAAATAVAWWVRFPDVHSDADGT